MGRVGRGITARADVALFAVGAALVGIGEVLPYAILPSGGVQNFDTLQFLLLLAAGLALLLAGRRKLAWLAMVMSAGTLVLAGYTAVAGLRAVTTWSGVWYKIDGDAGPSTFVMVGGLLLCCTAVFIRALRPRAHRTGER